jgi:hypothetical protein
MNQPQDTPTPRTDEAAWRENNSPNSECTTASFARTLERELATAQDTITRQGIDHMATLGELDEARRERDALTEAASVLLRDIDHCGQWVAPTPALDRLRDALKAAPHADTQYLDRPDGPGWWWEWCCDQWIHCCLVQDRGDQFFKLFSGEKPQPGIWTRATPPPTPKEEQP